MAICIPRAPVQLGDVRESPSLDEIPFHVPGQAFHLALGERVGGPAEPGPEADQLLERLVFRVPDRRAVGEPSGGDALHVVGV